MLSTTVIGAGPAGLMFCLIGKIMMGDEWSVRLYDKRETYVRTHRLRMAKEPYRDIQASLNDARFDTLMAFLEEHEFSPEVNLLEAKLSELLSDLGVNKEIREITALDGLDTDTIVGADSVHSTVRELVRGEVRAQAHTHERVARLRVMGPDLPTRLTVLDQYRLSKVLGSVVDYRANSNGFAEVDLFLTEGEHAVARRLGATPKDPVEIDPRTLSRTSAPLLRAVVDHLSRGERKVVLQSTFQLEHTVMPRLSFSLGKTRVFLVGDAGVSLPFFRGMACLASSAFALARAHASGRLDDYDVEVAEIVRREIGIVRARARVIHGLRELVRLSSMLPFPMQSWWLSAARPAAPDKLAPSTAFNALIAASAAATSALVLVSPWLACVSLPVQAGGGIAYRWTLSLEPGPHRYLRRVWEVQIAIIGAAGIAGAAAHKITFLAGGWWWIMGAAFVGGIYTFEWLVAGNLKRAALDDEG